MLKNRPTLPVRPANPASPPRFRKPTAPEPSKATPVLVDTKNKRPPRRARTRFRPLLIGLALVAGAITVAPWLPQTSSRRRPNLPSGVVTESRGFLYRTDPETFALAIDPRQIRFDLFEGWDRESEAYADSGALAYLSGPMYERHVGDDGGEIAVPLGDLKLGDRVWRGDNRTASRQRAFIGIRHDGTVTFGFGELTAEREKEFDTFIGGLHSLYNDVESPPESYRGAYSISMGQQIRYFLPRIRIVIGLLPDGKIEALMSRDGLTLEQTKDLARRHGMVAAYLPDHASKSRFIVPGYKGFSEEDANWISGGATSFVHVPYMLRLSQRPLPLTGSLLGSVTRHLPHPTGCSSVSSCVSQWGGAVLDHGLAGVNRLMDQVVDPLARMVWAPRSGPGPKVKAPAQGAPMREPVITADPQPVQQRQHNELQAAPEAPVPPEGDANGSGREPERPRAAPDQAPATADTAPPSRDSPNPERSSSPPAASDRPGSDRPGSDRPSAERSGSDRPNSERPTPERPGARAVDPPAPVLPGPAAPTPSRTEPKAPAPAPEARRSAEQAAPKSERSGPPPLPPLPPPPLPPLPAGSGAGAPTP